MLFVTSNPATFRISRRVSQESRDKGGERQRQKDGETLSEIERQRESQQTENGNRQRLRHRKSADKARGKEKKTHSYRGSRILGDKEG